MSDKVCVIRQPCGIGDIFFCQKIAKKVIEKYNLDVIWPVIPQFNWISHYLQHDRISYVPASSEFIGKSLYDSQKINIIDRDDILYIPICYADRHSLDESVMYSKYKFTSLSCDDWSEYFEFKRDQERENVLFYEKLKLTDDTSYIVVNKKYGSPPGTVECPYINISSDIKIVEVDYIEGVTIIDWCKVLERASQIHTVETAFNFIIEKLSKCAGLNMYSKHSPPSYSHVRHLFRPDWTYHL